MMLWSKAERLAMDARSLFDAGRYDSACNRAYYAMFNAARALLVARGQSQEQAKTHATVLRLFSLELVRDGPFDANDGRALRRAAAIRKVADYNDEAIRQEQAVEIMASLEAFMRKAERQIHARGETMTRHFLDHISLSVLDYGRAKAFYAEALAPLGIALLMEFPEPGDPHHGGFGADGKPFFWITSGGRQTPATHIAFGVDTRAAVDAFHKAALAAGGTDNGAPGFRAIYHPTYYGAFVLDPDGHNIEAVCHGAE